MSAARLIVSVLLAGWLNGVERTAWSTFSTADSLAEIHIRTNGELNAPPKKRRESTRGTGCFSPTEGNHPPLHKTSRQVTMYHVPPLVRAASKSEKIPIPWNWSSSIWCLHWMLLSKQKNVNLFYILIRFSILDINSYDGMHKLK